MKIRSAKHAAFLANPAKMARSSALLASTTFSFLRENACLFVRKGLFYPRTDASDVTRAARLAKSSPIFVSPAPGAGVSLGRNASKSALPRCIFWTISASCATSAANSAPLTRKLKQRYVCSALVVTSWTKRKGLVFARLARLKIQGVSA
jgi:hypothetical protein